LSTEDSPDLADDFVGHGKVRVVGDARSDIIELSDYAYQRTLSRLGGLTDDEYFWEPVPRCCTVRRTKSGDYRADYPDSLTARSPDKRCMMSHLACSMQ
jgi:hypothetical protein